MTTPLKGEPSGEQIDEINTAIWLKEHGYDFWLNRQSWTLKKFIGAYNSFHTSNQHKPDIVFFNKATKEFFAVEIKNPSVSFNVRSGVKILNYWENYKNQKCQYTINGININIKGFLVGTRYSRFGHLFSQEQLESNIEDTDIPKQQSALAGYLPKYEYSKTKEFLRTLWSTWREMSKSTNEFHRVHGDPSIGLLLSSTLDNIHNGNLVGIPKIFHLVSRPNPKKRGVQEWRQEFTT